ncbi:hypothetical protein Huta_2070 [Halorhabdus utahensis DSM 12940]|uniref:Uncharacterized protein n=1 Tax=Halorhabdus utahensis (strain DSM 12940 / JCM 11049 / AX-2) TaxID=519442 RepID=C7NTZ2_HALUD|nr:MULTISPECIES: hypothetical protein [Halorhabdus]ACV12237.1 hypothetical protein Huta_2070 [Halorhabdus utahensis DSM 12940]WEL18809.1 hypothetical protein SVXHr_2665 [Halorhabdus sp. SVX81]
MERTEKISTSVTEDEKSRFRVLAAERDMTMAELLRELVYEEIKGDDERTLGPEENPNPEAKTTD